MKSNFKDQLILGVGLALSMIVYIVIFMALLVLEKSYALYAWLLFGLIGIFAFDIKLYYRYGIFGSVYVTSSKALKENKKIAKERYEFINKTLSDDVKNTKIRLAKWIITSIIFFICMIISASLFPKNNIFEIVFLILMGFTLWTFFYSIAVLFKCKDTIKKEVIIKELDSIDNTMDYENLTPNVDLDTDINEVNEENVKIQGEQKLAISTYLDSGFDAEVNSSDFKTRNFASCNIKTKLNGNVSISVQNILSTKGHDETVKTLFRGLFAFFNNYKISEKYSYIRMTNSKYLVSRIYKGRSVIFNNREFCKNYFVYTDDENIANKVFSESIIERLNKLNEEYGYKYEVLIGDGDVYIRAYVADFLDCKSVTKRSLINSLAKDITYIDFIKKIASIMYDATKE